MRTMLLNYNKNQQLNNIGKQQSKRKILRLHYTERRDYHGVHQYRNVIRDVEPYSFRRKYNKKQHRSYYYFYAYCLLHNQIHSFRLDRLNSAEILSSNYSPRWEVELSEEYINEFKNKL